jgi:amino acid adenylation domain-containing protein/non-ribosomal peptide synthase protein (TIGR01720 family)
MQQEQAIEGYRLSPQQRRSWQLQQESHSGCAQCAVLIEGRLNHEALQEALRVVVNRHEILHTTFLRQPGRSFPLQIIETSGSLSWHEVKRDELEELYAKEKHRAFDLQKGPLLRATLITQSDDRHVLLLSLPALCADAWTLKNLIEETGRAYAANLERGFDGPFAEADEVTQYLQFSEWQHELLDNDDQSARQHWRAIDLEFVATFTLPGEVAVPIQSAFDFESYAFTFNAEVAAKVFEVAAERGISVGNILLACWSTLLWRLTRQSEIIVGASVDGRKYPELHEVFGPVAKVVPIKLHFEDAPFHEVLKQIDESWRDAYAFQEHFTWEGAAAAVKHPFIAVNYAYEERAKTFSAGGVSFSLLRQDVCTERFKIRLTCARTGNELAAEIHYDPRHLLPAETERLAGQFHTLLNAALANPAVFISDLNILSAEERHQLLFDFNNTRAEFPDDECLQALFEKQVERTPEATAVVFQQQRKSYQVLNAEANRLAHYLRKKGVGPEVCVGLCVDRSAEMLVGMLGILKAGGAYVPLDAEHPQARLSHQLDEVAAPVLVTQQKLLESLPPFKGTIICLDSDTADFADESDKNPVSIASAQNLAYVIYTSGSTGVPKGVGVSHKSLLNYTDFICSKLRLNDTELDSQLHFATVSTLSADLGNTCIFPALVSGGCLHVLGYDITTDSQRFANYVATNSIDVLKIVPSHLRQLLLTNDGRQILPRKYLITGGEALGLKLAQRIDEMAAGCRLLNHYGPTETTIGSVVNFDVLIDQNGEHNSSSSVPIGRPIANTSIYLLDEKLRPVPLGIAGEIFIGGEGVARGYVRQGGLTAERFLPDPFSGASGRRMYRTGDRGRYLPDGNLEFLGRLDGQVKVRGYRIELGEIESVLLQHETVRQAVVVPQGDGEQVRLVAYVITEAEQRRTPPGNEQSVIVNELRQHLRARVPDYMLPAVFVLTERLPLTANGKVDRRALALRETPARESGKFIAPQTPVEEQLAAIWREVLRCERVSVHDNFFELGGDSILSIQIIARANQGGLQLTPRQLFEHPTVAELAALAGTAEAVHAEQGIVSGAVPLTPIQQWFFAQRPINPHHWNMALLLEFDDGAYDPTVLKQVVAQLVLHHDALRLRYSQSEQGWSQFISADEMHTIFHEVDLSGFPETEQAAAIQARASEMQTSLDLEHGPLIKVVYFHLGVNSGARLLIVIHHLAMDGVSWRILLEDLALGCTQARDGKPISFPPKTTSFKEWAEQLRQFAQSEEVGQQSAYWLETAARSRQVRPLPVDHEGASNTVGDVRTLSVRLDAEETRALLQEVPETYHTQINEVLLTALALALAEWTGERYALVDMEGHGREEIGPGVAVTRTVGWFTTHYPMVLEVSERNNIGEALKAVKEQVRAVPEHGLGWGLLRWREDEATADGAGGMDVEAQISFNYLGQFDQLSETASAFKLAVESSGPTQDPGGTRARLIDITGSILGGRLEMNWFYSENVHQRETIEKVAADFISALRKIIAHCQSPAAGGYTPSDFPDASLSQPDLDVIAAKTVFRDDGQTETRLANLEDLYPLSPLQEGMLFQGIYSPDAAGIYIRQLNSALHGNVNIPALEQSWQTVIDRHPILRTSFSWGEVDKVLQLVHRRVELPLEQQDWRGLSPEEQERRLDVFLLEDHARGFDLSLPPLMRLTLIQTGPDSYQFIWTYHHLLLDGWSRSLVHKEVLMLYDALSRGESIQLPKARPYRDYIKWLEQQSLSQAEDFWRNTLSGFHVATYLGDERASRDSSGEDQGFGQQQIYLSATATAALQNVTRKQQLTLNTLVEGAWALLLSRYSGEEDILFGITISGRPASLPQVEAIVGPFINTLPLRVQVTPGDSLQAWLKRLQSQVIELHQYDYSPLMQVQRWSEIPRGQPLFESTFVLANYPLHTPGPDETGDLDFGRMKFLASQPYPLAVAAMPGEALSLSVGYDRRRFDSLLIARLLDDWRSLLEAIIEGVSDPEQRLLDLSSDASLTTDGSRQLGAHVPSAEDVETQFMF